MPLSGPELATRARRVAWLLLDVDGVLTDGTLWLTENGELAKPFHVRDGLGIRIARAAGIEVGILSARSSAIVARRAAEVGCSEILQGSEDKGATFREFLARRGVAAEAVAYAGDDLQDLPILAACGLSAAPADADPEVLARVDLPLATAGGRGAVRELVDRLLAARGDRRQALARAGLGGE